MRTTAWEEDLSNLHGELCGQRGPLFAGLLPNAARRHQCGMRVHAEAMQGKDVKVAPVWLATAIGALHKKRRLSQALREDIRTAGQQHAAAGQAGKEGKKGSWQQGCHRRNGDSPVARRSHPGQVTDPGKSFRGDGGAGGRATLFQKGPFPPAKKAGFPSAVPAGA